MERHLFNRLICAQVAALLSVAVLSGCTAGTIVDDVGGILSEVGADNIYKRFVTFKSLDDPTISYTANVASDAPNYDGTLTFSFDPQAPASEYNTHNYIPPGHYQIILQFNPQYEPFNTFTFYSDPINHSYRDQCPDNFTDKNESCSLYRLRLKDVQWYSVTPKSPCGAATTSNPPVMDVPMCGIAF